MNRTRTLLASVLLAGVGLFAVGHPVGADVTEPPGRCTGSAALANGVDGPMTLDSASLTPDDVTVVPLSDTVTWKGQLTAVGDGGEREVSGFVKVDLPFPFPDVTVKEWSTVTKRTGRSDTTDYSLPSITPRNVELRVYGEHRENGAVFCTGSTKIKIAGGMFGSPLAIVSVVALVLSAAGLVFSGKGSHPVLGGVAGLLAFGFLGATLMFAGLVPLNSILVTLLPVIGIPAGVVWGRLGVLGGGTAS